MGQLNLLPFLETPLHSLVITDSTYQGTDTQHLGATRNIEIQGINILPFLGSNIIIIITIFVLVVAEYTT